ncbi:MAG: FkbM family methyltransferase [Fibromonadaceae bacterium]|nr:FkbM family methyltransferase [Fibromonadaceae bacterium]
MNNSEQRDEIRRLAEKASNIDSDILLAEYLHGCSYILIYGAGSMGRLCLDYIKNHYHGEATLKCFLDINAEAIGECSGLPVYKADDMRLCEIKEDSVVIIAYRSNDNGYDDLENYLRTLGYPKIINSRRTLKLGLEYELGGTYGYNNFAAETENILAAFDLMLDEHSQNVFYSLFKAFTLAEDYKLPIFSPNMTQYFDVKVPFRYNYCTFIDCGAYIGDTLNALVKTQLAENYFGFEPDAQNYAKLSVAADKLCRELKQTILFPIALSDKNQYVSFRANGIYSSIDKEGSTTIQTVCLDDAIKNVENFMIKMDIEGGEIEALNGARKTITQAKPDMAISVYHRISDLWRIPLMLKEWVPEYKFYIRSHCFSAIDTVLYAAW